MPHPNKWHEFVDFQHPELTAVRFLNYYNFLKYIDDMQHLIWLGVWLNESYDVSIMPTAKEILSVMDFLCFIEAGGDSLEE